jgi:hypothetical protein
MIPLSESNFQFSVEAALGSLIERFGGADIEEYILIGTE